LNIIFLNSPSIFYKPLTPSLSPLARGEGVRSSNPLPIQVGRGFFVIPLAPRSGERDGVRGFKRKKYQVPFIFCDA